MNKRQKTNYLKATTAAAVAVSAVVVIAPVAPEASTFKDVQPSDQFFDAIKSLSDRGIIIGYPEGTFKPENNLTRGQAAKIIAGVLGLDTTNVINPNFKDIHTTDEYYGAIAALKQTGIIDGYPDGTFRQGANIQRNHVAKILANALNIKATNVDALPFTDVNADYKEVIAALYENKITTGKTAKIFDGSSNVTRGQMAAFITRGEVVGKTTQSVTFKVEDYTTAKITVNGKTYSYSNSVKSIFTQENKEALKGASIVATVKNGVITNVNSLTLNNAGTADGEVTFSTNTVIDTLIINADYVAVSGLTVTGDALVTTNVKNSVDLDGITVDGELIVDNAIVAIVGKGPKVKLKNSNVGKVHVKRNDIAIESDTVITEIMVAATVSLINVDGTVSKVTVESTKKLELTGNANIGQVLLTAAVDLALHIKGIVKLLAVGNPNAKVSLGTDVSLNVLSIPSGTTAAGIISNYAQMASEIANIIIDSSLPSIAPPINTGSDSNSSVIMTPIKPSTDDKTSEGETVGPKIISRPNYNPDPSTYKDPSSAQNSAFEMGSYTYVVYDFRDNRQNFAIAAFDKEGNFIKSWVKGNGTSTRYLKDISINEADQKINFHLDFYNQPVISVDWSEFVIEEESDAVGLPSTELGITVVDALGASNDGKGAIITPALPAGATGYKYQVNATAPTILEGQSTATGWTSLTEGTTSAPIELTNGQVVTVAAVDASGNVMAIQNIEVSEIVDYVAGRDAVKIADKGIGIDQKVFNGFYDKFYLNGIKIDITNLKARNNGVEAVAQSLQADIAAIFTGTPTEANGNSTQTFSVTVGTGSNLGKLIITAPSTGDKPEVGLGGSDGYLLQFLGLTANTIVGQRASEKAVPAAAPTGISINVVAGQITGTKATQEYSLDGGTTWNDAAETTTAVTFTPGDSVVVREKATAIALASAPTAPINVAVPATAPTANKANGETSGTIKLTDLTSGLTYEYVIDENATLAEDAADWSEATSVPLTGTEIDNLAVDAGQYVHLRVKATATDLASNVQNLVVGLGDITPAAAPDVTSIAAETLVGGTRITNLVEGVEYKYFLSNSPTTTHGDGAWATTPHRFTATSATTEDIPTGSARYIHIRVEATSQQPTSDIKSIAVVEKAAPVVPAAPTGISINVAAGQITGTTATQEYSLDGGTTWNDAAETTTAVTFTPGNAVVVREKATDGVLASAPTEPINVAAPATAPMANKAKGENSGTTKLTGLINGVTYEYIVDNNATLVANAADWSKATSVTLSGTEIDNIAVEVGQYVHLRVKSTQTTLASNIQDIAQIAIEDISPVALTIAAPTITATKVYDGTTTASVTAGALTGVAAGDAVTVNVTASYDNANIGADKTITVTYTLSGADAGKYTAPASTEFTNGVITYAADPAAAPATTFAFDGENAGKLMGATTAMEYSLDGGAAWTTVEADNPALTVASITDTNDIKVRVKATSNNAEGATQTIDITKAATPTLTQNIASAFGGVPNTKYLISYNGTKWDDAWADEVGKISISKGTWSVKVKSTGTVLESDVQTGVVSI